jgi:RND superfamily putative drug exporter
MNLLAAGACYGITVAVFQWGWGGSLLGIGKPGPIIPHLPVFLFAILFGLSMDYQVFLVSRIHEAYADHRDHRRAVAEGMTASGPIITAAAAIMVLVFCSFIFGGDRPIQIFGVGMTTAVLLDALVIRTALVPALFRLTGDATWWLPRWLDKVLPRIAAEGDRPVRAEAQSASKAASAAAGSVSAGPWGRQRLSSRSRR